MARNGSTPMADRLAEPGWVASLLFAAVATALVCYPVWPGLMSYDSVFAYEQAHYGVQTMLWPPLHTYMFQLSEALGARTWGVFVFQTFVLFASAGVILHLLIAGRRLALGLCVGLGVVIALSPAVLGPMLVHWRDVPTGSFAVPMSMPRYSCIASALTISARPPRATIASARSSDRAVLPVPVAPTTAHRRGIPHHLFDVLDPTEDAAVAWYQTTARAVIDATSS